MEFQLNIEHTATTETGMLAFLTFVKDNYPTAVHGASADSESKICRATLVLATLADCVTAVNAFKASFAVKYRLAIT